MELCAVEKQPLYRRRLRTAAPKSLEGDLQIAPPSQNNEVELDPDTYKSKPDIKEWVYKTALKISRRPCLAFSPSFLLSPISFSPVMIDDELLSPFACINQLISTPRTTPDIPSKSSESTTSGVFTFDSVDLTAVSSTSCLNLNRILCAIPEEREITAIDLEMATDFCQSQILRFRKADISLAPPKSPSIAIATKSKANSTRKKLPELDNSKKNKDKAKDTCQDKKENRKGRTTLVKGFEAKRRCGNSMFLSMVSR